MKYFDHIKSKILSEDNLNDLINEWREKNQKIVFTNGCFDLLHLGHIDYLAKAKDLGDKLIIGVNTDNSVRRLKGVYRPLQDENSRLHILAALEFVDAVILHELVHSLCKFHDKKFYDTLGHYGGQRVVEVDKNSIGANNRVELL